MSINTTYLNGCTDALRNYWEGLQLSEPDDVLYEICCAACVKEFEPVLEQNGQLVDLEEALRLSTIPFLVGGAGMGAHARESFSRN